MGLTYSHLDSGGSAVPMGGPPLSPGVQAAFASIQDKNKEQEDAPPAQEANQGGPPPFEQLSREIQTVLRPEIFDGLSFSLSKQLNPMFVVSHQVALGSEKPPPQALQGLPAAAQNMRVPTSGYSLGTILCSNDAFIRADVGHDGRLQARASANYVPWLNPLVQMSITPDGDTTVYGDLHVLGPWWNLTGKFGASDGHLASFLSGQTAVKVSGKWVLGAEVFTLPYRGIQGASFAAQYADAKNTACLQVGSTGVMQASYLRKVSEKAHLGTEMLAIAGREFTTTVGYDYRFRQARLRGGLDSTGKIYQLVEERMVPGVTFLLSAEIDHSSMDHRFGFGLNLGES
ncbi:unnamed protein product [Pedinophyceae sp. YPF-701]|nr:unnamed protein product [Pedinophyceae sp. YPF-701]